MAATESRAVQNFLEETVFSSQSLADATICMKDSETRIFKGCFKDLSVWSQRARGSMVDRWMHVKTGNWLSIRYPMK